MEKERENVDYGYGRCSTLYQDYDYIQTPINDLYKYIAEGILEKLKKTNIKISFFLLYYLYRGLL